MKCKNQDHLGKCFWEHGSLRWFISFTKVNPGHWQYCGCDAHEYGARWIPLAPWRQEVGSRVGEAVTGGNPISKGPDKSESHEEIRKLRCYHWCYLYCLVDNLFEHLIYHFSAVSCHIKPFEYNIIPLKKLKKKTFQDLRFISGFAVPGNGSQIFPLQRWTPSRKPGKFTAGSWKSPAWKGSFILPNFHFCGFKMLIFRGVLLIDWQFLQILTLKTYHSETVAAKVFPQRGNLGSCRFLLRHWCVRQLFAKWCACEHGLSFWQQCFTESSDFRSQHKMFSKEIEWNFNTVIISLKPGRFLAQKGWHLLFKTLRIIWFGRSGCVEMHVYLQRCFKLLFGPGC